MNKIFKGAEASTDDLDQNDANDAVGQAVPGFGLETLEQRILLSGDLPVSGADADPNSTSDQVDVAESTLR